MKKYLKADSRHPFMGLDNRICEDPKYWCKLHEVWLSESDVKKKQCKSKPTFDLLGTVRCGNLAKREARHGHAAHKNRTRTHERNS